MNKKKLYINVLKVDEIERLTLKEKQELCTYLNKKEGITQREIGRMLDKPHQTINTWIKGNVPHKPGSLHISIDTLINHFKIYKPTPEEIKKIRTLKEILEALLIKDIQYR